MKSCWPVDMVLANDVTAPVAISEFRKLSNPVVFDREKIALVLDHFTPNKDIKAAEQSNWARVCRGATSATSTMWVRPGEHALLPEKAW